MARMNNVDWQFAKPFERGKIDVGIRMPSRVDELPVIDEIATEQRS